MDIALPQQENGDETEPVGATDPVQDAPPQAIAPRWLMDFRQNRSKGFYNSLGEYALAFADRGSEHLLVSFDNLSSARDEAIERDPWGYNFAAKSGWSQLGVMTFTPSWFRDDELFAELRHLADNGFFKRFKSVTMTGTSMGGYAACAFSSLAPGCNVIAFSPQSTLKKSLVPWEDRFSSGRKADWSGEFADAATESGAASKVWLVYDPLFQPDVQHIDRFTDPNVIRLPARYSGHKSALFLRRAGILSSVVRQAVTGDLTAQGFFETYRRGRELPWYVNGVAERIVTQQHGHLMPQLVRAIQKMDAPGLLRQVEGRAIAAGMIPKRDNSRGGAKVAKPATAMRSNVPVDLYMSSPDLPPPVKTCEGIWVRFIREAKAAGARQSPWAAA